MAAPAGVAAADAEAGAANDESWKVIVIVCTGKKKP